jgi:hypothetical protein
VGAVGWHDQLNRSSPQELRLSIRDRMLLLVLDGVDLVLQANVRFHQTRKVCGVDAIQEL